MKTLKYILLLLLILIIGFSIYVAVQPNEFHFSRSRTIEAPNDLLYNKINDFKNWPSFSPWIEKDPEASLIYGDKTTGSGGSYSWNGEVLGEGSMKTLNSEKSNGISQQINFVKPFEGKADINWFFETTPQGTKVTWAMQGKQDFISKLFTTIKGSIESETGPDFERGLYKLDSIAQAEMKVYNINVEGITQHSGGYYLYKTASCKLSEFEQNMKQMLPEVGAYAIANNVTMAGPPFILYLKWDEENDAAIFSTCVPTNSRIRSNEPDILTGRLRSFRAVKTVLKGDYKNLKEAWETSMTYISDNNLEIIEGGSMLETYLTDPIGKPNPADWVTEIYVAIK